MSKCIDRNIEICQNAYVRYLREIMVEPSQRGRVIVLYPTTIRLAKRDSCLLHSNTTYYLKEIGYYTSQK